MISIVTAPMWRLEVKRLNLEIRSNISKAALRMSCRCVFIAVINKHVNAFEYVEWGEIQYIYFTLKLLM